MAFTHRKLILDSVGGLNITQFCATLCVHGDGYCSIPCIANCSSICRFPPFPSDPIPPPRPPISHHLNKPQKLHLLLSISFALLTTGFFLFCCLIIYRHYRNRQNSTRNRTDQQEEEEEEEREAHDHDEFLDEEHGPVLDHPIWYIRTVGLQPSVISAITVCKYKKGDGLVEGTECSVCLNEFQEDETLRLLPKCSHAFHIPCIDTWLRLHTNCPNCRAGIVFPGPVGLPVAQTPQPPGDVLNPDEETLVVDLGRNTEAREETEGGDCELGLRTEESGDHSGVDDDVQPIRRSVSLDSLSASRISAAIAGADQGEFDANSSIQLEKVNELGIINVVPKKAGVNQGLVRSMGSSSIGRSLQRGPFFGKRSFSCSGKVFLSRYGPSRNSNLPS